MTFAARACGFWSFRLLLFTCWVGAVRADCWRQRLPLDGVLSGPGCPTIRSVPDSDEVYQVTTTQVIALVAGVFLLVVVASAVLWLLAVREDAKFYARVDEAMLPELRRTFDDSRRLAESRGLGLEAAKMAAWRVTVKQMFEWHTEILIARLSREGTATGRYSEVRIRPIIERAFASGELAAVSAAESAFKAGATRMESISPLLELVMASTVDAALMEI